MNKILRYFNIAILCYTIYKIQTEFPFDKTIRIFSYYTNFNQLLVTLFLILQIYESFRRQEDHSIFFKQFHQFIIFSSLFVSIIFWIGYSIDQRVFLSRNPPPFMLLIFLHGGNAIIITIEYICINQKKIEKLSNNGNQHIFSVLFYYLFVFINYAQAKRFPYPFQKAVPDCLNFLGMVLIFAIVNYTYPRLLDKTISELAKRWPNAKKYQVLIQQNEKKNKKKKIRRK